MAKLDRVNALLESEGDAILENHEDVIIEAMTYANEFSKHIKGFILSHPEEFVGENTEDTYKNVRVFSEVATAQFINEVTTLFGGSIVEPETITDGGINEYL